MHLDPVLLPLATTVFAVVVAGLLMRWLRQPFLIGCILAGVLLGPSGMGMVADPALVERLGALGVVLLLFVIGMETSPPRLIETWRIAVIGTALQIAVSVGCVALVGAALGWPFLRSLLLGFVISLSSTAVVLRLLAQRRESDTKAGKGAVAILIAQDMAIVPMMLTIGILAGDQEHSGNAWLQAGGGIVVIAALIWMIRVREIQVPFLSRFSGQHELQVFAALLPCLGLAVLTGLAGLSTGLGAFLGGMLFAMVKEEKLAHESVRPLEALLVGFFFVSVGMIMDLSFLMRHLVEVLLLVSLVLLTNTLVNAAALRLLGIRWREGLHVGALLSQIGEFSFILAAVGRHTEIISSFGYQMTVATIALSMAFCPIWISIVDRLTKRSISEREGVLAS